MLELCRRGIAACRAGDAPRVSRVFVELIASLDFEYRAAATGLVGVYEHCMRCAGRREFDVPLLVLEWLLAPGATGPSVPVGRPPA